VLKLHIGSLNLLNLEEKRESSNFLLWIRNDLAFFIIIQVKWNYCLHLKEESYYRKSVNTGVFFFQKQKDIFISYNNIKLLWTYLK